MLAWPDVLIKGVARRRGRPLRQSGNEEPAKMASANQPGAKNRPLSPHLQIWRWGPAMLVSILHRVTGGGLSVVGLAVLLWWLGALVSGPEAYATFAGQAGTWYGL